MTLFTARDVGILACGVIIHYIYTQHVKKQADGPTWTTTKNLEPSEDTAEVIGIERDPNRPPIKKTLHLVRHAQGMW